MPTLDGGYRKFGEAAEAAQHIDTELACVLSHPRQRERTGRSDQPKVFLNVATETCGQAKGGFPGIVSAGKFNITICAYCSCIMVGWSG